MYILGAFLKAIGFLDFPWPIFGPPDIRAKEVILWPIYLIKDIIGTTGEGE